MRRRSAATTLWRCCRQLSRSSSGTCALDEGTARSKVARPSVGCRASTRALHQVHASPAQVACAHISTSAMPAGGAPGFGCTLFEPKFHHAPTPPAPGSPAIPAAFEDGRDCSSKRSASACDLLQPSSHIHRRRPECNAEMNPVRATPFITSTAAPAPAVAECSSHIQPAVTAAAPVVALRSTGSTSWPPSFEQRREGLPSLWATCVTPRASSSEHAHYSSATAAALQMHVCVLAFYLFSRAHAAVGTQPNRGTDCDGGGGGTHGAQSVL